MNKRGDKMFTRKFGKLQIRTLLYLIIITLVYSLVSIATAFIFYLIPFKIVELLLPTIAGEFVSVMTLFLIVFILIFLTATHSYIFNYLDKYLYKIRMGLKIENVYVIMKYQKLFTLILIVMIAYGFSIANTIITGNDIQSSILNPIESIWSHSLDTYGVTRRFKVLFIYKGIVYLAYAIPYYYLLVKERKIFYHDFTDGIYINKEFIQFNTSCLLNHSYSEDNLHSKTNDFFTVCAAYGNNFSRMENEQFNESHYVNEPSAYKVYTSRTRVNNMHIVASSNKKTISDSYYYLTNIDIMTLISSFPTTEEKENSEHVPKAETVDSVMHTELNSNIIGYNYGKKNWLKSIIGSILVMLYNTIFVTSVAFGITYLTLYLNFDQNFIIVLFVRFLTLIYLNSKLYKLGNKLVIPLKLENYKTIDRLKIIGTLITYLLYYAAIFVAIEFFQTNDIISSINTVIQNYQELYVNEIWSKIILFSDVALPGFFSIIATIIMGFTILFTGPHPGFTLNKGIYINKELVELKNFNLVLKTNVKEHRDNIVQYFQDYKPYLYRCNQDTFFIKKYKVYAIYYGYCQNLGHNILFVSKLYDKKIKYGKHIRVDDFGEIIFIEVKPEFITELLALDLDEAASSQWTFN